VPIYALGEDCPTIDAGAWVHPDAVIIGDVAVGPDSTIWPGAVLRGDGMGIVIGARSSVQDGSVIHCTHDLKTEVGDDCLIGHLVHLEGCRIESRGFVGTGAIVLHRCVVGAEAVVAAGAVVLDDTNVPPGALAVGVPARIRLGAAPPIRESGVRHYLDEMERYRRDLKRIG
jgi:carbonic anhydrase/acetyltransferase-like protein (isoleucine patch superfamily)